MEKKAKILTYIMTVIFVILAIYGFTVDLSSRFGFGLSYGLAMDAGMLLFWLILLCYLYDKMHLNLEVYSWLLFGMLAHIAGDFTLYGRSWGFLEYDMIMHFIFGFVLAFFIYNFLYLEKTFPKKRGLFIAAVVAIVLGFSAFHELVEFFGYYFLGEGSGILLYGVGDFGEWNDASFDMFFGLIGTLVAIFYSWFRIGKPK